MKKPIVLTTCKRNKGKIDRGKGKSPLTDLQILLAINRLVCAPAASAITLLERSSENVVYLLYAQHRGMNWI
jgi:hypothetical protein